jgi:hypothetical protein
VKVSRIFGDNVVGRQIYASTKPMGAIFHLEVSDIHVDDGDHGIEGMQNDRHSRRKKNTGLQPKFIRNLFGSGPMYSGEGYSTFFKDDSILKNSGLTSTTFFSNPIICFEGPCAISSLKGLANVLLHLLVNGCYFFF